MVSIELADVYINLVPSLKGAPDVLAKLPKQAGAERVGTQLGREISGGITKAVRAASPTIAAAVKQAAHPVTAMKRLSGQIAGGVKEVAAAAGRTQRAVVDTKAAAVQAATHITRTWQGTGSALAGATKSVGGFTSALRVVRVNAETTAVGIANTVKTVGASWSGITGGLPDRIGAAFTAVKTRVGGAASGIGSALSSGISGGVRVASAAASSLGNTIAGSVQAGVRLAGVALAGLSATIGANLAGAVKRADLLNNFPKVMGNIGFASGEASQQIKRISDSLDGLPTSTDSVVSVAKGLAPLIGSLTRATDVSLALNNALLAGGASGELAGNAMEQYRQMLANGTVDMMGWRSMTMAMPGQMDMIAKSLLGASANTSDLYEAMKSGEVTFDQFNDALVDLNETGAGGLASFAEQAKTATQGIGTAVQNAGNRVKKGLATIIEAIGVDLIAEKINGATAKIGDLSNRIAEAIQRVKDGGGLDLSGFAPVLAGAAGLLGPLLTKIPLIGSAFAGITGPVGLLVGSIGLMVGKSAVLRDALGRVGETLRSVFESPAIRGALRGLGDTFSHVATVLGDRLGAALDAVVPVFADMATSVLPPLINGIGTLVQALAPVVGTIITTLAQALIFIVPILSDIAQAVIPVIVEVVAALAPILDQIMRAVNDFAQAVLPLIKQAIDALLPVIQDIVTAVLPVVIQVLSAIVDVAVAVARALAVVLAPAFEALWAIVGPIITGIGNAIGWMWTNVIAPVVGWITGKLGEWSEWMQTTFAPALSATIDSVKTVFQSLWDKAGAVADGITSAFRTLGDAVGYIFSGLKSTAAIPINFIIDVVYMNTLKAMADTISSKLGLSFRMPTVSRIGGYASGGVLPGYTPGRDVYHFISHDGGGVLALSGGEAIMRPEWVRAVGGPSAVNAMNRAASAGRPIPGGDAGRAARFASGGIWDTIRGSVSSAASWVASAADAVSSIISDPLGAVANLMKAPVDAALSGIPGSGFFRDSAAALPGRWVDGFGQWLSKQTEGMAGSNIVAAARRAIGVPYIWGGSTIPPGVDCSGLVYWSANQMGSQIPRLTAAGYAASSAGVANEGVPGNLLFWGHPAWHVAITSGGGRMIEAPQPGATVRETNIWGSPYTRAYKFDEGGWLQPGRTNVVNATGKPEAVFTSSQWSKLDDLLARLEASTDRDLVLVDADRVLIGRMRAEAVGVVREVM